MKMEKMDFMVVVALSDAVGCWHAVQTEPAVLLSVQATTETHHSSLCLCTEADRIKMRHKHES